jgi:hypothetical protein
MENIATAFLDSKNAKLAEYEGFCGELVNDILNTLPDQAASILYLEGTDGETLLSVTGCEWKYHMVLVVDGMVHDAWHPHVCTVKEYLLNFTNSDIETTFA